MFTSLRLGAGVSAVAKRSAVRSGIEYALNVVAIHVFGAKRASAVRAERSGAQGPDTPTTTPGRG
jgi:hypothetical protein